MKLIELITERHDYWRFAETIDHAISEIREQFPNEQVSFAHDIAYSSIKNQFQNGSNEVPKG